MKRILMAIFGSMLISACTMGQREKVVISSKQSSDYNQVDFYDVYDDVYGDGVEDTTTSTTNTSTTTTTVSDNGNGQMQQVEQTTTQETTTVETTTQEPAPAQEPVVEPAPAPQAESIPQPEPMSESIENIDVSKTAFGALGNYKIGNPYLIDGVSYYPHEDYTYSEIGIASWYGPDFHGGTTSNGEVFDETKLTAAHRTLPMPTLVRVTNLENGISANIKVNDRGPYARDRILDLSSAAADVLGIKQKGTARVKVEILPDESKILKDLAIASQNTDIYPANVTYPTEPVSQPEPMPAPVAVAEPTPTPEPVQSSVLPGDYFVQVAAYSTYDKAEALKDKLAHLGTVKIFKAVVNGNTLFKVRLGEFKTKEEAERMQEAVTRSGISGSRVILKEENGFNWKV
ncbi:MAG: septal ring lytic transglycosylase RlpA family protein [Alphaproteobacteria bacterium]